MGNLCVTIDKMIMVDIMGFMIEDVLIWTSFQTGAELFDFLCLFDGMLQVVQK